MTFVVSNDETVRGFGIGKLVDPEARPGLIQYFISPADKLVERVVSTDGIRAIELKRQERIFYLDGGAWRVGRLHSYTGTEELGLRLPNKELVRVSVENAYVRSTLPITNPVGLLQTRSTETPFWHEGRSALVRSFAKQRAVYRGLTGMASANVEIYPHQLTIARRVINDPIPRYLLADEVGLGKTIEAGLIVRQHLLDNPHACAVLIVVPEHLVTQWQLELKQRFHIGDDLPLRVVAHNDSSILSRSGDVSLLIVDEAHVLAEHAYDQGKAGAYYRAVAALTQASRAVLLLSATPVVHNEDAYLAMLHLLDPTEHRLSNRDDFHLRIRHREAIGSAVRDLQDDASGLFVESALESLRLLAEANPLLASYIDSVRAVIDKYDDPARVHAIAELRTHLQESYRLDRRLLRTRRVQTSVRNALPKRKHEAWIAEDSMRGDVFEWLDQWRFNCADSTSSTSCATTLFEFIEASLRHPSLLVNLIADRKDALDSGAAPYFDGEREFLLRGPELASVASDPRVHALEALLRGKSSKKRKWVIFVSDSRVADQVVAFLMQNLKVLRVRADETAADVVSRFRNDKEIVAVICDEQSENGLNVQGIGACAVHFDLPFAANRIEQRIGRLDRIGGDPIVTSFVPVVTTRKGGESYESAWAKCLIDAVQVFDRSVASLQHALDAGRRQLFQSLLVSGVEAIDELSSGWRSKDGPLSLDSELRSIESQELLDELEAIEGEQDLYEEIETFEYGTDPSAAEEFSREINTWTDRSLQLHRHVGPNDTNAVEYAYTRETLVAADRFAFSFKRSFSYARRRDSLCTGWIHYDRDLAMKLNLPLARVGHPFIEDLQAFLDFDERGRAYACWREVSDYAREYETGNTADLFFRFDFLVEANLPGIRAVISERGLSAGAVARRATDALAPQFTTIWVDVDGAHVTDPDLVEELERPYDKTDTNLRGPLWQQVDELGIVADWPRVCESVHASASSLLRLVTRLEERISRAERQLELDFIAIERRLASRISVSDQRIGDREALETERSLYECLLTSVTNPRVRVDSVGAVFLSETKLSGLGSDG